jgi:hypothetical protein
VHGLLSVDGGWQTLTVESCLLMYIRGYKNRAIAKKMFEISLIFKDSLECQLFVFKAFFDYIKTPIYILGTYFI